MYVKVKSSPNNVIVLWILTFSEVKLYKVMWLVYMGQDLKDDFVI